MPHLDIEVLHGTPSSFVVLLMKAADFDIKTHKVFRLPGSQLLLARQTVVAEAVRDVLRFQNIGKKVFLGPQTRSEAKHGMSKDRSSSYI